mmetsp:Transcript_16108/g.19741  ORF Transcript_16108/g.19741 Transcript_16108/m.19741 type:complete len:128 (+) Transcript_16108:690-1073(+)
MHSYTWVSDKNHNIFVGDYHPKPKRTAHRGLANNVGISTGFGGAMYTQKDFVYPVFESGTLNVKSVGKRNISDTLHAKIIGQKLENGDYYKAYNMASNGGPKGCPRYYYNEYTDDIKVKIDGKMESI